MNLEPATLADADVLAGLHALAFDTPWSAPEMKAVLEGPGAFGFIARGDAPAGMILARAVAGEAEILTLAVDPAARRGGIGRALVAAACGAAAQAGAEAMFLEVAADNTAAISLYLDAGFAAAGLRRGYYDRGGQERMDALVLRLDLNSASA